MNVLILLLELIIVGRTVTGINYTSADINKWNSFQAQFKKKYSPSENLERMKIFFHNLNVITKHNERFRMGKETFQMGMNHFGDMSHHEFRKLYLPSIKLRRNIRSRISTFRQISDNYQGDNCYEMLNKKIRVTSLPPGTGKVPSSKNWAKEGAVTRVKDQGMCGCCWAFSIIAVTESHNYIRTNKLKSLSEQNLLDCMKTPCPLNHSCDGGSLGLPFQYIVDHGINTEQSYPYQAEQGSCEYDPGNVGARIKKYYYVSLDEDLLRDIVGTVGPVTGGFTCENYFMQFYKSGVYSSRNPYCGKQIWLAPDEAHHAVAIVGYGREGNTDYWLAKNSWGPRWGDRGYFKIRRNTNECGIGNENYFPGL